MIPKSFRWFALLGVAAMAISFSGCLIEGPAKPPEYYSYLRVQPDYALEAEPTGKIYEMWAIKLDSTATGGFVSTPLVRFHWNPELYLAIGQDGDTLPLTTFPGVDVGVNLAEYFALTMSIEPVSDPNPIGLDGPMFLVNNIDTAYPTNPVTMFHPFLIPSLFGQQPSALYTLVSQSNKKGKVGVDWRDGSEGYGVWFCAPSILSKTVFDYEGAFNTYSQIFVPPAPDSPFTYTIWINAAHPESSWSNFGRVFDSLEPDITFIDGVPQHPDTLKKSVNAVLHLGEEPIYIGGTLVGYRYYSGDFRDTCDLRIDNPALTRSTRDKFDSLVFDVQAVTPRQFTLSQGDTSMAGTIGLPNIIDFRNRPEYIGIFDAWEYEAWLVFDKSTGIKPLSMGRFANPNDYDSDNRYCYTAGYDSNFAFPGEDFLRNLSQHDPQLTDSINVITDPRVKKLWITIEPRHDPANGYVDWAPDEPFMQMIAMSAWFPNSAQFVPDNNGVLPDATRPMSPLDRNPGPESLNEGHYWPTARVTFNRPTE
ncbi:MAG: hypothetical protein AB1792_04015 [Candidatus Zixiibacteriota bacterium]